MQQNKGKDWYHRPLWATLIGGALVAILAAILYIYTYRVTQGKDNMDLRRQEVQEKAPNMEFGESELSKDTSILEVPVMNYDHDVYFKGNGHEILTSIYAYDQNDKQLPIEVPDNIVANSSGVILVDVENAEGKVYLEQDCQDTIGSDIKKGGIVDCIPKGVKTLIEYELPNYRGLKFIGIDATYGDDNIDFSVIRKYLKDQGAIFYGAQSPGKVPEEGVLRIDAETLFKGKKVLFAFYNDNKNISDSNLSNIERDLLRSFTHLEEIRFYSFTDYYNAMNTQSEMTDIRHVFGAIGDCNLKTFGGCSSNLYETGNYPLFTKNMINNDIDILFIIPAVLDTKRLNN